MSTATPRIAMVAACPFPHPRGTPTRVLRTAEALRARGLDVHVITYHLGDDTTSLSFPIHRIPPVSGYRKVSPGPALRKFVALDPALSRLLVRVIRDEALDVIHAHHYEGLLAGLYARWRTGVPVVYDAHTLLESELPTYRWGVPPTLSRVAGRWLDRQVPRRADYTVAVSDRILNVLTTKCGVPPDRAIVAPSGVEANFLAAFHKHVQHRPDYPCVMYAGGLAPYQGVELLLQSFRLVLDRKPDARLVIVTSSTDDGYHDSLRQLDLTSAVDFVCEEGSLPERLAEAHVAVSPRVDCDGTPQKVLNYMATGRPIVSFATSGRVLTHGDTGWLVDDGDVGGFADGILHLLDHPDVARRLGARAHAAAADNFGWNQTTDALMHAYARARQGGAR